MPLVVLLAVPLVALTPSAALTQLGHAGTAPLVALVALVAWACECWLLAVAALTLIERRSGRASRGATQLLRRLAPAAVRTAARIALGATLATGVTGVTGALSARSAAASAAGPRPVAGLAAAVPSLDWPVPLPTLALDWPLATGPGAHTPPPAAAPVPAPSSPIVVVQPGDCLWQLAARALGPSATAARTAATWPSWWSANRAVIGDDPDLLRPGTRLVPPA